MLFLPGLPGLQTPKPVPPQVLAWLSQLTQPYAQVRGGSSLRDVALGRFGGIPGAPLSLLPSSLSISLSELRSTKSMV